MVICWKFKKNLFNLRLSSFHDLINVYSCRSGADNPRGQNFYVNRNLLSLQSFATNFKKISVVWFYTFLFHDFIHVYSPGQGLTTPWELNFDVNRNILSVQSFVASFKKMSLKCLILYNFFHDLIHVYNLGQGVDSAHGTNFWCQQEGLMTLPICDHLLQVSKKSLWTLILYNFFHDLIHVYSPWAWDMQPPGDKVLCQQKLLITSIISC